MEKLLEDLLSLQKDTDSADIVFLVGDESDVRKEERIYAHKIILMARCKSFQNTKRGEICRIPGSTIVNAGLLTQIRLPLINPDVFRQFILYVYTGKIAFADTRIFEMMNLAQLIQIEELKLACEDHIVSTLSITNSCTYLIVLMDTGKCPVLIDRITSFIGENARECVKTTSFLNLSKEGIVKLISSDYFSLEEESVWRSVLSWAKHQAGVTQQTSHWTNEERLRVCQFLSGVMVHVRLLLIDSQVFAEEVEPTGAVPMELSLERYRYAALKSKKPPTGQNKNMTLTGGTMTENDKRLQPRLLINLFPGSAILKNDKLHLQGTLNNWYGVPKQIWRLVFRASTHAFEAEAFHRQCDNISPTFIIALGTNGEISGGFSDVPWAKTSRKGGYIHSENAFLFTLNSNNEPPAKYDVIKKPYAICYHPDCGPIFGAGADFLISNNCNSNTDSYSNFPHSYDGINASTLFGDYNFSVVDYEVYTH